MTVGNPQLNSREVPSSQPWVEDEIDLRQYVRTLMAWWREIVAIGIIVAVLAAGGVIALRFLIAPEYEAAATVAIARTTSNVNFDERFQTSVSEVGIATAQRADVLVSTRRASLLGLVYNGAIAQTVYAQLSDLFDEGSSPASLLSHIEAEVATTGATRSESDLIRVVATFDSPELAATVANAWAEAYVVYVNRLYGQVPEDLLLAVQSELAGAEAFYDESQRTLESFIAQNDIARYDRLIAEKQQIVDSLQAGKQTAIQTLVDEELAARRQIIAAYVNAHASNRLLAFNKEQQAKQSMISALIDAESNSRLHAFQQERTARQTLFDQYVAAELENRALALATDQSLRRQVFEAYANADARTKVAVFNEQVDARLQALAQSYDTRQKLNRLLEDARSLLAQAEAGGDGAVATNSLAILLLKAQLYSVASTPDANPNPAAIPLSPNGATTGVQSTAPSDLNHDVMPQFQFQLVLDDLRSLHGTSQDQVTDLNAAIAVLESRIADLDGLIFEQSQSIYANADYALLDAERPADDPLLAATQAKYNELFELGALATQGIGADSELAQAIQQRYEDLFALGPLAVASTVLSSTTPLAQTVEQQYPQLFDPGALSTVTEQIMANNGLVLLSEERARELLQLQGLEDLPSYSTSSEPLAQAIDRLEDEIQTLQAQREAQIAQRDQLIRDRDLALKSLTTLSNKNAELRLAGTAANSEVRFGTPALPPLEPLDGTSLMTTTALAGIVGIMFGIFVAFVANFLGAQPVLGTKQTAT